MLLLIDFEATGVDPKTARIIEIGAMVVDHEFNQPEAGMSQLVWEPGYPALTPDVVAVTHITQDMLNGTSQTLQQAMSSLAVVCAGYDIEAIIAYNRKYDETLFKAEMERHSFGMIPFVNNLLQLKWLCAMEDIESNYKFKSWKQMHVALEYGITVNPKSLHRAINDVDLMRNILKESGTTPEAMWAWQSSPWMYVAANVKPPWTDGGKSSDEAKSLGFKWQAAGERTFDKTWVKRIKPHQYQDLQNKTTLSLKEIK